MMTSRTTAPFLAALASIFCFLSPAMAQGASTSADLEPAPMRVAVFTELGGAGGFVSANAELQPSSRTSLRLGISAVPDIFGGTMKGFIPVSISAFPWVSDNGHHRLEVTAGATLGLDVEPILHAGAGYRYQSEGGFLLRATATPLMTASHGVQPWGGLAVGLVF